MRSGFLVVQVEPFSKHLRSLSPPSNVVYAVVCLGLQATVSVIPAASSLILKALNEPERDRKKVGGFGALTIVRAQAVEPHFVAIWIVRVTLASCFFERTFISISLSSREDVIGVTALCMSRLV